MTVLMGRFFPLLSHVLGVYPGRWLMMKVIGALVRDFMVMSSSRVLSRIFCCFFLGGGREDDPEKIF